MKIWQASTLALLLLVAAAEGQGPIRLKTREIRVLPADRAPRTWRAQAGTRHYLVQFGSFPEAALRQELERRGMRILAYVPEFALMVSSPVDPDLEGLDAVWAGALEPGDKLSPALDAAAGAYMVLFHPDADMDQARSRVRAAGLEVLESGGLPPHRLLVTGSARGLALLAREDAVAYIMAGSTDLAARRHVWWCDGPITEAGPVADYALTGAAWPKDTAGRVALVYAFLSLTTRIDGNTARSEMARAFREWARYANVTFAETALGGAPRSVDISFLRGSHGDGYPFDGPGGVLAHTFYPAPRNVETIAGDMHLDADENWGVGTGVDLFSVVLHEAGHALGLAHSDRPGSVMYPYYSLATGLTADDIAGVQALYGPPASGGSQPSTPSQPTTPTQPARGTDTTAPSVQILVPSLTIVSASSATIAVSGTASDNVGVTSVAWSTSNGDSGAATGTTKWSATVRLLVGTNTVVIRAYDAAGNSAWRSLTAVRR